MYSTYTVLNNNAGMALALAYTNRPRIGIQIHRLNRCNVTTHTHTHGLHSVFKYRCACITIMLYRNAGLRTFHCSSQMLHLSVCSWCRCKVGVCMHSLSTYVSPLQRGNYVSSSPPTPRHSSIHEYTSFRIYIFPLAVAHYTYCAILSDVINWLRTQMGIALGTKPKETHIAHTHTRIGENVRHCDASTHNLHHCVGDVRFSLLCGNYVRLA